jgi:hypothetical protein
MDKPEAKKCENPACTGSVNVSSGPVVGMDRAFCSSCEIYYQRHMRTIQDWEHRRAEMAILARAKKLDW